MKGLSCHRMTKRYLTHFHWYLVCSSERGLVHLTPRPLLKISSSTMKEAVTKLSLVTKTLVNILKDKTFLFSKTEPKEPDV